MTALAIALGCFVLVVVVAFLLVFNRLIRLRNRAQNAWRQIDVQLKRRYDLLPEFARIVQGYATHEKETFVAVTEARARAMDTSRVSEKGPAEDSLTSAIGSVYAVAESYPDLKAASEFRDFQAELSTTENRIAGARKYYNGAVMYYDNARQGFPGNVVAGLLKGSFPGLDYFEMQDEEGRKPPPV